MMPLLEAAAAVPMNPTVINQSHDILGKPHACSIRTAMHDKVLHALTEGGCMSIHRRHAMLM